jgi:hypothetical protein
VIGNILLIVTLIIVIMFIGRYFQKRQLNEEK